LRDGRREDEKDLAPEGLAASRPGGWLLLAMGRWKRRRSGGERRDTGAIK
jgi:hypothetical protein